MKGIAVAVACALVGASATALSLGGGTSVSLASPAQHSTVKPAERLPAAAEGRVFLTQGQVKQALASGTIDRPIKSLLSVDRPLHFGDYRWNEAGIPAGPVWIRIDLGPQLISVFRGGHEIGTAVIVYGGDNKETPTGKLHILGKARNHRSSIYDAEMPYTLRLTNDGVSIHGSRVEWGAATHGCIGVPLNFAERLFDATRVGDDVTIIPASQRRS